MKQHPGRAALLAFLLALAASGGAYAAPPAIRASMGGLGIINLDPEAGTSSSTCAFPGSMGLGLELGLTKKGLLSLEPGFELYQLYYRLDPDGTTVGVKPLPMMGREYRDAWTMGLLAELPLVFNFGLGKLGRLSFGIGPAFNLRYGIQAAPNIYDMSSTDDDAAAMQAINSYFWAMGRWFTPSTFLRYEYGIDENSGMAFTARGYWPVFNFWTAEGLSFFDQMIVGLQVAAVFRH